jgi:archaellum component FlaC
MTLDTNIISDKIKEQIELNFADLKEEQKQSIINALLLVENSLNDQNLFYDYKNLDSSIENLIDRIKKAPNLIDGIKELINEINRVKGQV